VPAEIEEAVARPHLLGLDAEHLGEDPRQPLLGRGAGGDEALCGAGPRPCRRRQGLAVDLAIGGQGECLQDHVHGRPHEWGQPLLQPGAELRHGERRHRDDQVGRQPLVAGRVLTHRYHRLAHCRMPRQDGLDLPQLDAVAAQLHLVVQAAQEDRTAVRAPADQVARAVEAAARAPAPGVREEALGGQLRPLPVTARHALAADQELAGPPHRHGLQPLVHDAQLGVGDRPAQGDGRAALDPPDGRPDRRLGRAVHVEQLAAQAGGQALGQRRRQGLAAHHQALQSAQGRGRLGVGQERRDHGRGALQVRDPVARDEGRQGLEVAAGRGHPRRLAGLAHRGQLVEALQHGLRIDAEVDQAGDLVDSPLAQLPDPPQAGFRRAEEPAGLEVALEGAHQEGPPVLLAELLQVLARRQRLHQVEGARQVARERPADHLAHLLRVVPDKGVEHERDVPRARMAGVPPSPVIEGDLLRQVAHCLAQQVGQEVGAHLAGEPERVGAHRRGEPERQLGLHRARQGPDLDLASAAGQAHRLPPP
jgi:hypothetical protein